jgi:signal transduction histidine kinase
MRELLADLAGVSSGSKSTFQICNIRHVIDAVSEAVLPIAERQGVRIVSDSSIGLQIPLVRSRMERVFLNLIANALEGMPHGGEIRIGARQRDNGVLIEVEDTGPGIPRAIQERLFEPFVTAGKDDASDWG